MKKPDTVWSRFANQFHRQPSPPIHEGDVSAQFESDLEDVWQGETTRLNEAWDRIRALVTRGNAAGAVASLTLLGSQQLVGRNPRLNVFWALVIFAAGLLALLVREFLIVWHIHYQRKGKVTQAVDEWDAFNPPPFIMKFARSFEYVSTILMVVGGVWGFYVLYGLTRLECK